MECTVSLAGGAPSAQADFGASPALRSHVSWCGFASALLLTFPQTTARSGATAKPKEEAPKTREQAKKPKEPPAKEENRNVPGVLDTFVLSQGLRARAIGPAIMGGRVAALALDPMNPYTFYVWLGTGGGMKTTDNGQRFTALFQKQPVAAIGAISVAPVCAVGREYGHAQVCRYQAEGEVPGQYCAGDRDPPLARAAVTPRDFLLIAAADPAPG
jgi:hypothetical protein